MIRRKRLPMPEYLVGTYTEEEFQDLDSWKRKELRSPYRKRGKYRPKKWSYYLTSQYNLSEEDYWKLFNEQNGVCAICGKEEVTRRMPLHENKKRRLCVDHSHTTGIVRGLLCNHCNSMLGNALDDPLILSRAITYLKEHDI